jgi:hypothetical protein
MKLILALLLAQATGITPVRLAVGQTKTLPTFAPPLQLICDDLAVVDAKLDEGGLQLTGKAAGRTVCSVLNTHYTKVIYEVTVTGK